MDIASIIGLALGTAALVFSMSTDMAAFIDIKSVFVVFGGSVASLFVASPVKDLRTMLKAIIILFKRPSYSPQELIIRIVKYAEIARRDGILALENVTADIKDEFLVKGLQLAVDGTDPELIEQILTSEIDSIAERHSNARKVFDVMGKYAPAWGLIGTIMGLILLLKNLSNTAMIGPSMALALVTTFYGAIIANFVFLPMSDKLAKVDMEEKLQKEIILRGVIAIQSGDNPRIVEQKLKVFLPPSLRAKNN